MRLPEEPDLPFQINIVPMIDVVFAVLTFFIMSSLYLTRSQGLPVNLPSAKTSILQESTPITITIDAKGQISLNRQAIELDQIEAKLSQLMTTARPPEPPTQATSPQTVIISADDQVSHGRVVAVMDRVRQVKGTRLAIQTQQPR